MYINVMHDVTDDVHRRHLSRRFQLTLTDRQYALLADESDRTGLAMAEIVRRAIDAVLRPHHRVRFAGYELNVSLSRQLDAALAARRLALRRGGQTGGSRMRVGDD
jgi:hypothetical protein